MHELIAAFKAYEADESRRCLILTGNTEAFAAGADIKELKDSGYAQMFAGDPYALYECLTRVRKPWIAAVAGFALGGGASWR